MNQIKPVPVSEEVASRYPINIFLTYTKAGERQHALESFPPGCTPAMLGTMMQTGLNNLGDVSPYGVRLLVNSLPTFLIFSIHVFLHWLQHDAAQSWNKSAMTWRTEPQVVCLLVSSPAVAFFWFLLMLVKQSAGEFWPVCLQTLLSKSFYEFAC